MSMNLELTDRALHFLVAASVYSQRVPAGDPAGRASAFGVGYPRVCGADRRNARRAAISTGIPRVCGADLSRNHE
jgi:hypothetical protein